MLGLEILKRSGLGPTPNRIQVVEALVGSESPVTPQQLFAVVGAHMNRVTLYRILDMLVEHGVVTRHNDGGRAFRYCLGLGPHGHAHFHCRRCGRTQCLATDSINSGLSSLTAALPMRVEAAELSMSGVCQGCMASS